MELLQLKYFEAAARCESFARTAEKFGVPPSDISQSIKRLERELGHELFVRTANRVRLSDEGSRFLDGVSIALLEIERATASLSHDPEDGRLRILAAAVRRVVMQTVERFKRIYPEVEVTVSYDAGEDPQSFDLAVSDSEFTCFGRGGELILSEEMILAINRDNPLAKKERISPDDLKSEAFISMGKETSLSRTGERILREAGITPNVSVRSEDPFYVRRCIELGLGMAIVPAVSWRGLFGDEVVLRSFLGTTRDTYLFVNERKRKKKCVEDFSVMLREDCSRE